MQTKEKRPGLRTRAIALGVVGVTLFIVGVNASILLGLGGSLFIAGAVATYYEDWLDRSKQIMLLLGAFIVVAGLAWAWLGWNEGLKRSCIPEGDCPARHQFNSLERLDQQLFRYYDNWADKPR
jgi:hypothetical protein